MGVSRVLALGWVTLVVIGFGIVWRYAAAPGAENHAPTSWPHESKLPHDAARPTLVTFLHPRCPCSRATVTNLESVARRLHDGALVVIVFVRPPGAPSGFEQSDLRESAKRITSAVIFDDHDGLESKRFGVETSGATVLYDARGALAFSGGITDVRGHAGTSFGEERIVALVSGGHADRHDSPVFGCGLLGKSREETP